MSEQSNKSKQSALHKCYQLLIDMANESEQVGKIVHSQTANQKIPEPEKREEIKR